METAIHAERDGKIVDVLVRAGDQIDAKDLLVSLRDRHISPKADCPAQDERVLRHPMMRTPA